ncbi:molybdopterin-guanine dinucleotide biosynthesis protein B [Bacillus sp. FSL H8-0547]
MALGEQRAILQITGFQNSGKTAVMEQLIKKAHNEGYKAGTIKHHGHGGTPDQIVKEKDSGKHLMAGSKLAGVEGGGVLQLSLGSGSWTLEELLKIYSMLDLDLILIEGYKHELYPKAVCIRNEQDLSLLELNGIVCVIADKKEMVHTSVPVFSFHDEEHLYLDFLMKVVKKQYESKSI